jgi:hypothetical protein
MKPFQKPQRTSALLFFTLLKGQNVENQAGETKLKSVTVVSKRTYVALAGRCGSTTCS